MSSIWYSVQTYFSSYYAQRMFKRNLVQGTSQTVFFFFLNINRNLLRDSFKMCYKLYTGISLPLSLSRTDFLVLKNRGENKHTLFYLNIL